MANKTAIKFRTGGWLGIAPDVAQRNRGVAILFVLPALVLLLAITIYPLIRTVILALSSQELTVSPDVTWAGLDNFVKILTADPRFWSAIQNTLYLVLVGVGTELVLGVGLALMLNEMGRTRSFWISLFLIPVMIAPVVAALQFKVILSESFGPINFFIKTLTGAEGPAWLADPHYALFSIMLIDVWQWTPFMLLISLAGLQSISVELLEAAEVDGATYWDSFWRVKLPLLLPVLVIGILIRVMDTFKTFDMVFLLTGGGPGNATETIAFYTYLNGFKFFSMGYTAAMAFIQLVVIIIVSRFFLAIQNRQQREVR